MKYIVLSLAVALTTPMFADMMNHTNPSRENRDSQAQRNEASPQRSNNFEKREVRTRPESRPQQTRQIQQNNNTERQNTRSRSESTPINTRQQNNGFDQRNIRTQSETRPQQTRQIQQNNNYEKREIHTRPEYNPTSTRQPYNDTKRREDNRFDTYQRQTNRVEAHRQYHHDRSWRRIDRDIDYRRYHGYTYRRFDAGYLRPVPRFVERRMYGYVNFNPIWINLYRVQGLPFYDQFGYYYGEFTLWWYTFEGEVYRYDPMYTYEDRLRGRGLFDNFYYEPYYGDY